NFAMTSFITTGGIRGGSEAVDKFQPRSFNMGLSRHAFEAVGGFGNIHPGEDPDLAIRLWQVGHTTKLIPDAYVFHKRRISWNKFSVQVNKFGKARPILDSWYPQYAKPTYFLPSAFCVGFLFSLVLLLFGIPQLLGLYLIYFIFAFCLALYDTKNGKVALYSLVAIAIQFYGYGTGFAESYIKIRMLKRNPQNAFPQLFFKAQ